MLTRIRNAWRALRGLKPPEAVQFYEDPNGETYLLIGADSDLYRELRNRGLTLTLRPIPEHDSYFYAGLDEPVMKERADA